MAKEQKTNRVLEILKKEYPFERVLLGVLGAFVVVLGTYLIQGDLLEIELTNWWIFDSSLKRLIFAIVVTVVGAISLLMSIWPFFVPSFAEMKKVTWPNRKVTLNNSARVYGFIFVLIAFFVLISWPLEDLFLWIETLGA